MGSDSHNIRQKGITIASPAYCDTWMDAHCHPTGGNSPNSTGPTRHRYFPAIPEQRQPDAGRRCPPIHQFRLFELGAASVESAAVTIIPVLIQSSCTTVEPHGAETSG
ncbi:hypothetical protein [Kitasatospora sp. GP82]|uniref:hypothetical protein n=1 Tax=Kitasatospora sp. GP82 TaxID=3035089 RepID=UPI002476824B|nr:hypothetical protein [Kitasatospora sp. GP82]MDH6123542.1 hypothetical protein [Kitasatospora sp. GP82]